MDRAKFLSNRIKDNRSKKVVFVSHCLLNANTRYLGGAVTAGADKPTVVPIIDAGTGIVQMPCPEQIAWGGVSKKLFLLAYGSRSKVIYLFRSLFLPAFILYSRIVFYFIARQQTKSVVDYVKQGYLISAIVGIDGSPSCGLNTTIDIKKAFEEYAKVDLNTIDREHANHIVRNCALQGPGLFLNSLKRQLQKRKLNIEIQAYDLISQIADREK